jgi:hypothetical protein
VPVLAEVGKDARFLDLFLEALERAFKVLFVVDNDFGQRYSPRAPRWAVERIGILGRLWGVVNSREGPLGPNSGAAEALGLVRRPRTDLGAR